MSALPLPLEVVPLDGDRQAWDAFVTRAERSSFCHLAAWRDILNDVLGVECLYRMAIDDGGAWQGVLPLVRVKSWVFGHYVVSLPFLNYGGPLGSVTAQQRLVADALTEARRSRVDLLELRIREGDDLDLPVSARKITVVLPLPLNHEALFQSFPSKLRSQIRRPLKEGLTVRFGLDQREPFYEVFAQTMRDLGTPVLPAALFERIAASFPDFVTFGVVYRGDQPLAGGCGFVWRGEFEMTWAGALRASRPLSANMMLYWEFMKQMIARGVHAFNFGRCTPESGTHHFKKQWGGIDVPLLWRQWSAQERTAMPTPDRPIFRLATSVWRRLPLSLTKRIGPVIARQIP